MTWKISDLIAATIAAEVELAVTAGEMDRLIFQKLWRVTKDKRYRHRKAARNLERVHAVAEKLKRERGICRLGRKIGRRDDNDSSRL